jgi:ubiquitin C-terminal hydrolase
MNESILSIEKYKDKGLSGLANLGNTCFINSCIQILSHTYEFHDFLEKATYKKKLQNKPDSLLLVEFDELRKMLWSSNVIISPGKFIKTVQQVAEIKDREIFTGYSQNDSQEFLLFLMDCFHNAIAREVTMTVNGKVENETDEIACLCFEKIKSMYSKEYSEIWNLFYAIHVSEIISLRENDVGTVFQRTPEPFFMIHLPIPPNLKSPNLYNCFDLYVEGEKLEGENAWFNEKTRQKEDVKKKISFWSLPTILVIDLKRFNNRNQKNQILVDFPLTDLDLSKYVIGYKKEEYVYDLYGICNHSGSVFGGHYTSYVKNANEKWYHFNDTSISELGITNTLVSPKAYCLFYRKRKIG